VITRCKISQFVISYRSCDLFRSFHKIVTFLNKLLSFSYTFHYLNILYPQKSGLTTLFYRDTFRQINVHYKCFKIFSLHCLRSNKTGCERGPPCFSLLATSLLKIAKFLYSSIVSYQCTVHFIYTTLLTLFQLIHAFSTKV